MKSLALLLLLTLTLALGAWPSIVSAFQTRSTDSVTSSDRVEEPVPLTDRVPWLIYLVLTSSSVALAWILFSLARARMRNGPRNDDKPT